ncbi:MAG: DNA-binding protein [Bacteroides sp.]|nr:DNA-binding protein [Bacteroides sp.]
MSKLWHPQAVSVGKPVEMDELCKQIVLISTVSSADTKAALEALGLVLGTYMNSDRTVHVEGLGTFYYTCVSNGKGVDDAKKVNANQIQGTRVRFVPESRRQGNTVTRGLISEDVTWTNVNSISGLDGTGEGGSGKPGGSGGSGDDDQEENPLG